MFLRATLFGALTVFDAQGQPLDLGSPTTRSLLAYLLLHRRATIERRHLAFLLWPRAVESAARRNLRQYLHHLKLALARLNPGDDFLLASGSTLRFSPHVEFDLDFESFEQGVRPDASLDVVRAALDLYRGDLLVDLYDDWCDAPRDHFRRAYLNALDHFTSALQAVGRLDEAIQYAQKWVNAERLDENAHSRLITLYALNGERAHAAHQYQNLTRLLREELHAKPLPETQALFQSLQQGDLRLQSGPPSIPALRVRSPAQPRATAVIPLIGRNNELGWLDALYHQAQAGQGKLVFLSGASGIGKTRLIQEYLSKHSDASVLQSVCYELESMQSYAPLRGALDDAPLIQSTLTVQRVAPPGWIAPLLSLLPSLRPVFPYMPFSVESDALPLREALINLLLQASRAAQPPPLHLILDDLHWADIPTWELLAALARRVMNYPLLIFGLYSPEDLTAERRELLRVIERSRLAHTLEVAPLTREETTSLLTKHLAPERAADRLFCERLHQDTEGNPFFVIEAVRAFQEGNPSLRFPFLTASIQRVIEARLDRLQPGSREALASAAAIGMPFSLSLLETITERPAGELVKYVEEWLQRGLVQEVCQGYEFRHETFRQVAYSALSRARREYLHRRIAQTLECLIPPVDVSVLAYHFARSDQPLQALPWLTRAGEQALRLRSYHEARQFGLQAINLLGQLPGLTSRSQRIDINLQLAQAYAFSGDLSRAIELLNETERLAVADGDNRRLGSVFRRAAQFFWLRGHPGTAGDYARRALRVAEELDDPPLLYAALRMLGRVSIALSAFDDAIAYLVRYVNMYEELSSNSVSTRPLPDDLPIVLGYLGVAYSRVGAWDHAYHYTQRGLKMALQVSGEEDTTTSFARMQLAMVHIENAQWQAALDLLAPIPTLAEEDINPPLYMALSLRGYALARSDRVAEGLSILKVTTHWAEKYQHRIFHYLPRLFLGEALLQNKDLEAAHHETSRALEESQSVNARWAMGISLRLLAEIETRCASPPWAQIEARLIESMQLLRQVRARPDLARTYLALRHLYDRAGQIAWAVDCHFRATTIFEELGMTDELRQALGHAAHERRSAVVLSDLPLRGPNQPLKEI